MFACMFSYLPFGMKSVPCIRAYSTLYLAVRAIIYFYQYFLNYFYFGISYTGWVLGGQFIEYVGLMKISSVLSLSPPVEIRLCDPTSMHNAYRTADIICC